MNGILGTAHLMRRQGVTPAQAKQLDTIEACGRHLLGVINSVLDISKIEAGRFDLEHQDFSVAELVQDVALDPDQRFAGKRARRPRSSGAGAGQLPG